MPSSTSRGLAVFVLALTLVCIPVTPHAKIISTETAMASQERADRITRINAVLARENVREALIGMGVDPVHAGARVQTLTDAELRVLEGQLERLPAGGVGVVEVVGIVAIVLIVLELLGVTNVFTRL